MKLYKKILTLFFLFTSLLTASFANNIIKVTQGAGHTICAKITFTKNGAPITFNTVKYSFLDGATGAQLISPTTAKCVELSTPPATIKVRVEINEGGYSIDKVSDVKTYLPSTTFSIDGVIEVGEALVGPVTTTTPSPGASGASPTPATGEIGYCGDDGPDTTKMLPVPAGTTPPCSKTSAEWVKSTAPDLKNPYCISASGGLQPYFYKCPGVAGSGSPTPTKTPTPTPYTPIAEGKACVPSQGPWQCVSGNYCAQSCSSLSPSCTSGVCCRNGFVWSISANTCIPPVTTGTPAPVTSPTPIATSGTCNDSIQTASGTVSQVCSSGSTCAGGAVKNPDAAAHESCSLFYSGGKDKTGYTCCQLPLVNQSGAGSSCQVSGRLCDTSKNQASGQNVQCSGCGGYCIKPSGGGDAFCQSI